MESSDEFQNSGCFSIFDNTFKSKKAEILSTSDQKAATLVENIIRGKRRSLAKGITLIESKREEDFITAQSILELVMLQLKPSIRVGITGVPGVGKSTFIEALGTQLIEQGHRVAVLAVDPSSPQSGGSILGDKTRMEKLSSMEEAFIRPSPSGGMLGGVARKTRESMFLCEAAGYDVILIETVGVGQSEMEVASMVDLFMVMLLPGAGDSLQGIKRGILELADLLVINKAEGEQHRLAITAKRDYQNALHLLRPKYDGISVPVKLCSSVSGKGIDEIWGYVLEFTNILKKRGLFEKNRQKQQWNWLIRMTEEKVLRDFWNNSCVRQELRELKAELMEGKTTPVLASRKLLRINSKNKLL